MGVVPHSLQGKAEQHPAAGLLLSLFPIPPPPPSQFPFLVQSTILSLPLCLTILTWDTFGHPLLDLLFRFAACLSFYFALSSRPASCSSCAHASNRLPPLRDDSSEFSNKSFPTDYALHPPRNASSISRFEPRRPPRRLARLIFAPSATITPLPLGCVADFPSRAHPSTVAIPPRPTRLRPRPFLRMRA